MNGKAAGRGDANSNSFATVSDLSPESQLNGRAPRSSRKAATFGKRSNSMRRNPKAEISKQGWLYKQASNGMKQWNKRWFVLTDRCLFYYKDEKEEGVLGSLPLLGFRIRVVQSTDNISRKYAFKVSIFLVKKLGSNRSSAFCLQAEHAGIRTYYFSAETLEEQEDWVQAMSEAARMHIPPTERNNSEKIPPEGVNSVAAIKGAEHHQRGEGGGQRMDHREAGKQEDKYEINGGEPKEATVPNTPTTPDLDGRTRVPLPNGWGNHGAPQISSLHSQESQGQRENTVLRRGFVPRTQPERLAQRKSSMTQLQQWVNQRRSMAAQEDLRSPSRYYTVNRGVSADYCGVYGGGPPYMEEYPLYPPGVRPDSICSVSGGFDRLPARWAAEERRRSLRDGPLCGREPQWAVPPPTTPSGYYAQLESAQSSMRRLSMQPRSRSVPRSPCGSSPGPYSPGPHNFASPVRSPSARFDRGAPGRHREDPIYADPSIYGLRRSLSSPKVFKLLGRLCEQNRLLKDQEMVVQRLRIDKDSLEAALVITHQELEVYRSQPSVASKLQIKKETLQNQLINIRGELSQASSALTTTRMEFEALEDEVNVVHGDLWEQLNACGQVKRHIICQHLDYVFGHTYFYYVMGIKTTNSFFFFLHSGTNSPASPLSSVSLTSPLSPFSPISGSQGSPTKLAAMEVSHTVYSPTPSDRIVDREAELVSVISCSDLLQYNSFFHAVGVVPPRTKSPTEEEVSSYDPVYRRNGKVPNGISRERPKSAVFPAEVKSKMSVEEQNERIRRNQSSSMRDKRRSLNLSSTQQIDGFKSSNNYRVVRRRLTAHEVDIKDLEAAVRGEGVESPREEIARLRRLQVDPDHYNLDIGKQLSAPDKVLIPERYLDIEPDTPLSPEEEREKQKKVERIKTLIAKSNMQNMIPLLDGPAEGPTDPEQQLQEQEKRIEISCTLAAEASRRSRLLSGEEASPSRPVQALLGAHHQPTHSTIHPSSHASE
uniref:Pleckstrin homology domain containing A6 n=1 Tax=Scleropages formosus TaxID=113540 RepID=A0A8C9U7B8_SCLFO